MRHTVLISALCALLGVPTLAQALYLVGDGYSNGSESMTLTTPPPPAAVNPVGAGGFVGRIGTTNPPTTPIFFWCMELSQTFGFGTVYSDYTASILGNTKLAQLFTKVGGSAAAAGGAGEVGIDMSAAFQIAIWEILFETNTGIPYDVSTGNFMAAGDADVVSMANAMLTGLDSIVPTFVLIKLHSDNNQDFITDSRLPPPFLTPEPSPLPLLGIGILAVMIATRRRTQRASR